MRQILQELGAKNPDPFIPKPPWMTQARYDQLILELDKSHTRATAPLLDLRVEFPDEYQEPDPNAKLERLPAKEPAIARHVLPRQRRQTAHQSQIPTQVWPAPRRGA